MKKNNLLPNSINVFGVEYKIFIDSEDDNPKIKDNHGYCETLAKELHFHEHLFKGFENDVMVLKDWDSYWKKVMRHELIHAMIYESGLGDCCEWANNESLVDWISMQAPKMLEIFSKVKVDK